MYAPWTGPCRTGNERWERAAPRRRWTDLTARRKMGEESRKYWRACVREEKKREKVGGKINWKKINKKNKKNTNKIEEKEKKKRRKRDKKKKVIMMYKMKNKREKSQQKSYFRPAQHTPQPPKTVRYTPHTLRSYIPCPYVRSMHCTYSWNERTSRAPLYSNCCTYWYQLFSIYFDRLCRLFFLGVCLVLGPIIPGIFRLIRMKSEE